MSSTVYIGIDIQESRGCPYAIVDEDLCLIRSGWLTGTSLTMSQEVGDQITAIVSQYLSEGTQTNVGIDAPRQPLNYPREYYFTRGKWRKRRRQEKGTGRHCEVVLKSLGIANPQWTPLESESPSWMILGFSLFRRLDNIAGVNVYEVFPSASYQLLNGDKETRLCLSFNGFARGPKDMLDACVAAVTVYKYKKGEGCTVGGGDGLGTIILPADLTDEQWQSPVHKWPR